MNPAGRSRIGGEASSDEEMVRLWSSEASNNDIANRLGISESALRHRWTSLRKRRLVPNLARNTRKPGPNVKVKEFNLTDDYEGRPSTKIADQEFFARMENHYPGRRYEDDPRAVKTETRVGNRLR